MATKIKKSKTVCVPFDEPTYIQVNELAEKRGQSVASLVRGAVMILLEQPTQPNIIPVKEILPIKSGEFSAPVIVPSYENDVPALYGPPTACPVCEKEISELDGKTVIQLSKNAWACYECCSSGRWSTDAPATILKNTMAGDSSPAKE